MEGDVQRLLDTFIDLQEKANVNACFGEPVTVEGRTVIPIARVGYGFGMAAGRGPTAEAERETMENMSTGGGGGGGITTSPLGVIEVTSEGTRIEPIIDEQKAALAAMLVGAWSVFWLARTLVAIFGQRE